MGLSLGFSLVQRGSVFGDIPVYDKRNGNKPKVVLLSAPHTNEHGAVLPFREALKKKLESEGIQTRSHTTKDMMERGWGIRRQMGANDLSRSLGTYNSNQILLAAFGIEDFLFRLKTAEEFFSKNSESVVLELHAMGRKLKENDTYYFDESESRLRNTKLILIEEISDMKEIKKKFGMVEDIYKEFGSIKAELENKIKSLFGFDMWKSLHGVLKILHRFEKMERMMNAVELPSKWNPLPAGHPMFSRYYRLDGDEAIFNNGSEFERAYCGGFHESVSFTQQDVDAVAATLVLPPKKG